MYNPATTNGYHQRLEPHRFEPEEYLVPPKALDAERAVIGSILRDATVLPKIAGILDVTDFVEPKLAEIYRSILELHRSGVPVDPLLVGQELARRKYLVNIGGAEFLMDLYAETIHGANGPHYAEEVKRASSLRNLFYASTNCAKRVVEDKDVEAARALLTEALDDVDSGVSELVPAITMDDFLETEYTFSPIVENILIEGQPLVIGGKQKTLKTTIALALAIAIATGTYFLGKFRVRQKMPVWFLSGESGGRTIQETAKRIARRSGITLKGAPIHWSFTAPKLSQPKVLREIERKIKANGIKVIFFDPLYLCLLDGDTSQQASNLFSMGQALMPLTQLAERTGVTLCILHHFRKTSLNDPYGIPELEELSMAGVQEWARSWLLIARREPYESGSGIHKLWMTSGGSAGHGGQYALNVNEGTPDENLGGRQWETAFESVEGARKSKKDRNAEAKEADEDGKVLKVLRKQEQPLSATKLKTLAGMGLTTCNKVLARLVDAGEITRIETVIGGNECYAYELSKGGRPGSSGLPPDGVVGGGSSAPLYGGGLPPPPSAADYGGDDCMFSDDPQGANQ